MNEYVERDDQRFLMRLGYNDLSWVKQLSKEELKAKLVELQDLPTTRKIVMRELDRRG